MIADDMRLIHFMYRFSIFLIKNVLNALSNRWLSTNSSFFLRSPYDVEVAQKILAYSDVRACLFKKYKARNVIAVNRIDYF